MSAVTVRPLWSLVAESFQDAARDRGLIDPAGRCLPPPFGCGEKPANSYGMYIDCIFELREEFDLESLLNHRLKRPLDLVAGETVKEGEFQAVETGSQSPSENHKM